MHVHELYYRVYVTEYCIMLIGFWTGLLLEYFLMVCTGYSNIVCNCAPNTLFIIDYVFYYHNYNLRTVHFLTVHTVDLTAVFQSSCPIFIFFPGSHLCRRDSVRLLPGGRLFPRSPFSLTTCLANFAGLGTRPS